MKNMMKICMSVIMVGLVLLSSIATVSAATVPSSVVVSNYEIGYGNNPLGINRSLQVKKDKSGHYMYCMDYNLYSPSNTEYTSNGPTTDNGIAYILGQGANNSNDKEYAVTQVALWIYMLEKGLMKDSSSGSIKGYTTYVNDSANSSNKLVQQVRTLVANAKKAGSASATGSLSVDKNATATLNGDNYVSSVIKVTTTASDYTVSLKNAPSGAKVEKVSGGFVIKVPSSSITSQTTISADVTAKVNKPVVNTFKPKSSSYQRVSAVYNDTTELKDTTSVSITPVTKPTQQPTQQPTEQPKPTPTPTPTDKSFGMISIIKKDKDTNTIIEGAALVLTDSKGNVIDKWISSKDAHIVKGLKSDTYTITETTAPEGYELSNEKLTVTVKEDICNICNKTVVFYNKKVAEKGEITEPIVETPEEIINVPVESTGMTTNLVITLLGLGAIASGVTVIYRRNKNEG